MSTISKKLWTPSFIFACIANFLMGFSFYLLMPTLPFYLSGHFAVDKGMVGLVMSCYVIAALLMRPFSGYLVDMFPRKPLYLISFVCFVTLTTGYLVAGTILFFIVLRFCHGAVWGIITTSCNTLAIDIMPSEKRGEGIGYYGLMLNLAMAVGPMVGLFLYDHYDFFIIFNTAIVSGFVGLLFAFLIKAPAKIHVKHQPLSLDRFILKKGIPVGLNLAIMTLSYGMILSFAAMYGKEKGVSNTGLFFTFMAIGMGISRIFSGKMIDRGQVAKVTIWGISILSIGFVLLTLCITPLFYYIASLFIGVGYGVIFSSYQTLTVNLGTHHQRGTANSTFFIAMDLGIGLGIILAGKVGAILGLSYAFGISAVCCFLGLLIFIQYAAPYYSKNKIV